MDIKPNHAIMLRSQLRNYYPKKRSFENRVAYKRKGNFGENLLQFKKRVLWKTWLRLIDNKMFCKSIHLFFSNKSQQSDNIKLTEGSTVITDDEKWYIHMFSDFNKQPDWDVFECNLKSVNKNKSEINTFQ